MWDGRRWAANDTGEVDRMAAETVREMLREAVELDPILPRRKELVSFALACESKTRISNMLSLARSQRRIRARLTEFDRHPRLLNVANGTLDLRSGKLHGHKQANYLSRIVPVAYDPEAKCLLWERFLREIMDEKKHGSVSAAGCRLQPDE